MKTCAILGIGVLLYSTNLYAQDPEVVNCAWEVYIGLSTNGDTYEVSATNAGGAMWGSDLDLTQSILGTPAFSISYNSIFQTPGQNWPYGFDFINSIQSSGYSCTRLNDDRYLPYGLFKIRFEGEPPVESSIYLDLRDDRYCNTGLVADMYIRFNESTSEFEFYYYTNWYSFNPGDTIRIWEYDPPHSTGAFQPTDPSNLSLSNYGGHPKLTWTGSEPLTSAKYIVYRNNSAITDPPINQTTFTDQDVSIRTSGSDIYYKIRAVSGDGSKYSSNYSNVVSTHGIIWEKPEVYSSGSQELQFGIECSYPNPANPVATIVYSIASDSRVSIIVYDAIGREVKRLVEEPKAPGRYAVTVGASDVSSGQYFCRMVAVPADGRKGFVGVSKMIILK